MPGGKFQILGFSWDESALEVSVHVSIWLLVVVVLCLLILVVIQRTKLGRSFHSFEIDQAEIGVGNQKIRITPNSTDRQIAYAIWVELSTRKIGLPIDLENDVVAEIYDSWHHFFGVTRELIKTVPVQKFRNGSTQAIVSLSIEVLNEGLRPHLTKWQARFRRWYDRELKRYEEDSSSGVLDPQELQAQFPKFDALKDDMLRVNESLMRYREKMRLLILQT